MNPIPQAQQGGIPGMGPIVSPPTTSFDPLSIMIDQEVLGMVVSRKEQSKTWRRMKRLIWDRITQNLNADYDTTGKESWQSHTFMPLTQKVSEIVTANLHQSILGTDMPVEYQARRSDYEQAVRGVNEVISDDFEKCSGKVQLTDFIRNLVQLGTSVGEVGYRKEYETVMVKNRIPQMPKEVQGMLGGMGIQNNEPFIPKQMLVKDFATISNLDLYDVYPQPRKPEISKDAWIIIESKITNRELVNGMNDADPYYKFDNVNDDLLNGSGAGRIENEPEKQIKRYALLDYNYYSQYLDPDREHILDTFYGQIPIWYLKPGLRNNKKFQYQSVPGVIKVVDGQWIVWKRISPWRDGEPPFFKGNYIRIPGPEGFYGIGVPELVIGLQTEKNEIRNSRMDNINLSMNKIFAVLKDRIPKGEWDRFVSKPGAIWPIKGIEDIRQAIQQIEFGDVTKDSWEASAEVDREAEEVTAANKVTQSVGGNQSDAGGATFRGQQLNVQQAMGRWLLYARTLEWTGLTSAFKKFYQRIYQFKELQDIADILGPDRMKGFNLMVPEELEKIAKLVPLGVMSFENKGVKLAQLNQFTMQWQMQPWFKGLEIARTELNEMGYPEPDKFVFSDEEMGQYNQMKQMMITAASQNPGLSGPPGSPPTPGQPQQQPQGPQTGPRANVPGGQPVAGNVPGPLYGMPRPALPARGPGASPMDLHGMPTQ